MARPQTTTPGYKVKWVPVGDLKVIGSWRVFYRDENGMEREQDSKRSYSTSTSAYRAARKLNKK